MWPFLLSVTEGKVLFLHYPVRYIMGIFKILSAHISLWHHNLRTVKALCASAISWALDLGPGSAFGGWEPQSESKVWFNCPIECIAGYFGNVCGSIGSVTNKLNSWNISLLFLKVWHENTLSSAFTWSISTSDLLRGVALNYISEPYCTICVEFLKQKSIVCSGGMPENKEGMVGPHVCAVMIARKSGQLSLWYLSKY